MHICYLLDDKWISGGDDEETKQKLSRCLSELEDCLREVLSDVLEVEMKVAYEDLWLEVKFRFWSLTSLHVYLNLNWLYWQSMYL